MIFRFGNFSEWVTLNLFQFIMTVMTGAYAHYKCLLKGFQIREENHLDGTQFANKLKQCR